MAGTQTTDEKVDSVGRGISNLSLESDGQETTNEDENEQHGNQTPQQKSFKSQGARQKVKKQLSFSGSASQTKEPPDLAEQNDGEWLKEHPWKDDIPNRQELKMAKTVDMSKVYTVKDDWLVPGKKEKKIDLEKVYSGLPKFIDEMKGPSIRQELEDTLQSSLLKMIGAEISNLSPHVREIYEKQKNILPTDKPSYGEEKFKAYSLKLQKDQQPSENNYWYLDCEYMLTMYLPNDSLQWFEHDDQVEKRIRAINPEKKNKRWVFIPSFRRAKIALLNWPTDDIVTSENTIRILVVRPSEFDEYLKECGHLFPVIRLPQDEIGAGYPRLWIQKIALRLKLDFIWMIDDSVECFYEYHPTQKPPSGSYKDYRRLKFGLVFDHIEELVKATKDKDRPIAAMSPKRFMGGTKVKDPYTCTPPRIAVFLNLKALKSKEVYYRPELQVLEDMIFGFECEKNGLKVFIDNRIHLQDHKWEDTGARSLSVQQEQT